MQHEEWRPVSGYEGRYEVSCLGRVRSTRRKNRLVSQIKLISNNYGVNLHGDNGKSSIRPVRRLVLEAFVGPQPNGTKAAHKNGDPADARLTNLEWRPLKHTLVTVAVTTPEEWRAVEWTNGRYEVSNHGQVRAMFQHRHLPSGRLLGPAKGAYLSVRLHVGDGRIVPVSVHSLVAEAFIGKRSPKHQVNHKNGNKLDNRVENLEWATAKENERHKREVMGYRNPTGYRITSINPSAKLTPEQVREIRTAARSGTPRKVLAERYGLCRMTISKIKQGRTWKHLD